MPRSRVRVVLAASFLTAAVVAACRDNPPPTAVPPDSTPPNVRVLFPDSGGFDRDSNGLVDVEVVWSDSIGAVDPRSLTVRDVAVDNHGALGPDLAGVWLVKRTDAQGAVIEESVPGLLSPGWHQIQVSVADSAGNRATAMSDLFFLPPAAYNRTIDLHFNPACQTGRGVYLALSADGSHGYAPFQGHCIAIFRTDPPDSVHFVQSVTDVGFAAEIALDTATGLAYLGGGGSASPGVTVFDTRTERIVNRVFPSAGVAGVDVHDNRLFVGEACTTGKIYVLDKASLVTLAVMDPQASTGDAVCANAATFAFRSNGAAGWAGIVDAALVGFDADAYAIVSRDTSGRVSFNRDIALARDRWLYVAEIGSGLDEIDLTTGAKVHYPAAAPPNPALKEIALSPDAATLFVSADPDVSGPANIAAPLVFDVPGLRLRYALPWREGQITDAATFHPDGKRVFVIAGYGVYVYLIRPRAGP